MIYRLITGDGNTRKRFKQSNNIHPTDSFHRQHFPNNKYLQSILHDFSKFQQQTGQLVINFFTIFKTTSTARHPIYKILKQTGQLSMIFF